MQKSKVGERYIRYVKRHYYTIDEERTYFLEAMSDSVFCYLEEHPNAEFKDLKQHFGSARDFRNDTFIHTKTFSVFVRCTMAACLLLGLMVGYREYLSAYETRNGYFVQQEFDSNEPPMAVNKNEPSPIMTKTRTLEQDTISPNAFNTDLLSQTKEQTVSYYDCEGRLCWKMSLISSFKPEKDWGYVARYCTRTLYIYQEGWETIENEASLADSKTSYNVTMKKGDLELYGCTTIHSNKYGAVNAKSYTGRVH